MEFRLGEIEDSKEKDKHELLWSLMSSYLGSDVKSIQKSIVDHVEYTLAASRFNFTNMTAYMASAYSLRDRLIESWNDTQAYFLEQDAKRVSYLSLEFLMGRTFQNALVNLDLETSFKTALMQLGYDLEDLYECEPDAALGNGGLGRLAACFLDSMATLNLPAWGYGIRYTYGIFEQQIRDGRQVELPDYWLTHGSPWEIERKDISYPVRFYGNVTVDSNGKHKWDGGEIVEAVACDSPIPGYDTYNTINLRLWKATPPREFDLQKFNEGDYGKALEARQRAETIFSVLYPNDNTLAGKELRLKQQYFFVCATLQDLMKYFKRKKRPIAEFSDKNAIQLNDTHPAIAIPELFRILVDEEGLSMDEAWPIVEKTFAYTNHTVLPEALEKWSTDLMGHLLPRHLQIIYDINWYWMKKVEARYPGNVSKLRSMSIIEEGPPKMVRMAILCVVCSHAVNGVAALHSRLVTDQLLPDFKDYFGHKFQNKTNGVTPRRWIHVCNPALSKLLTKWLGTDAWLKELGLLTSLRMHIDDKELHKEWQAMKLKCKTRLAKYVKRVVGITVSTDALFDVQVKRIHEYKRQLLNALYCIHHYRQLKAMPPAERAKQTKRVSFFGGKSAPGYAMAKIIIKLINDIGEKVNNDPDIGDIYKVVFIPNYKVSNAEIIIPASDISEHISTAGTEASGTSNMKFAMNGGLIIGTLDGANVEIVEETGDENNFIFGALTEDVNRIRHENQYHPTELDPDLAAVLDMLRNEVFCPREYIQPILDILTPFNDYYLLTTDFRSYVDTQAQVSKDFKDKVGWTKKSIANSAGMGKFSTDRTIEEYAQEIWNVLPLPRPDPRETPLRNRGGSSDDPDAPSF